MLDLASWNCEVDNTDENVARALNAWVALYQPDVIALSEAMTHGDILRRVAPLLGYRLHQQRPAPHQPRGDDTGDCALLVAAHVRVRHRWVARMRRRWRVVSHNRWHQPHAYEVASVRVRGQRWRIWAAHFPTLGLGGPNAAAWLESARRTRRWLRRGVRTPSVVVGDINEQKATVARWYGPPFKVAGSGIDVLVSRRVAGGSSTHLGRFGSDHSGRLYTLVASL